MKFCYVVLLYLFDFASEFTDNNMVEPQITLREFVALDVTYHALCIEYPELTVPFELKSGLVQLLPKFSGLTCEDPHKHLKKFHVVCFTPVKPEGVIGDHIKLRAFPFSLQGAVKYWFYYLEQNYVTS